MKHESTFIVSIMDEIRKITHRELRVNECET